LNLKEYRDIAVKRRYDESRMSQEREIRHDYKKNLTNKRFKQRLILKGNIELKGNNTVLFNNND